MSVITRQTVQCWAAPIYLGESKISIVGSWKWTHAGTLEEWHISPERMCHVRVGHWKQQIGKDIVPACLDISISDTYKCELHLKVAHPNAREDIISHLGVTIERLLRRNPHAHHVLACFQQVQPGAGSVVSVTGNAGSDGVSQSD